MEQIIRENITPRGDGNQTARLNIKFFWSIRENITPRGDGNSYFVLSIVAISAILYKREYNSERRRKRKKLDFEELPDKLFNIRENITPRGDGNLKKF